MTESGAELSDDGLCRFDLWRGPPGPYALFVGLNPSTADATADDATIRRLRAFTARFGLSRFHIVNLCPLRAREPKDMAANLGRLTVDHYERNTATMRDRARDAEIVVRCWGVPPRGLLSAEADACSILRAAKTPHWRLGPPTKGGHPRHPLYLRADTALELAWSKVSP